MATWDFSTVSAWRAMEWRASTDARDAVLEYWPRNQHEANPDMPQDLDVWARQLTMQFLGESMGLPIWAIGSKAAEGVWLTVRTAYYVICRPKLEWHVCDRIMSEHALPRMTTPPAALPQRRVTYPLYGDTSGNASNHHASNSGEGA